MPGRVSRFGTEARREGFHDHETEERTAGQGIWRCSVVCPGGGVRRGSGSGDYRVRLGRLRRPRVPPKLCRQVRRLADLRLLRRCGGGFPESSEESRVGKECVRPCRYWWSQSLSNKNMSK